MNKIPGYDFSSLDDVDVTKLPKNTGFVILRAIRQNGLEDTTFQDRYHALKNSRPEIARMGYLFFNWYKSGASQANLVLDIGINFKGAGNGPIVIDLEADSGSAIESYIIANRKVCIAAVNECIATFRASDKYGRQDIIIYSNNSFLRGTIAHTWPDALFWMASYQSEIPSHPAQPVTIWQFAQYGRLDMTSGKDTNYGSFDLNYFTGTVEQLNKLANIV